MTRIRRLVVSGLIPAHAGKTSSGSSSSACRRAHPRSRGENHRRRLCRLLVARLIPAHAGKTRRGVAVGCRPRAHPRSRGENRWTARCPGSGRGSSPLTRGKLVVHVIESRGTRLIPAHAGKTAEARRTGAWSAAHPRSRGENIVRAAVQGARMGSSPLTRGKRAPLDNSVRQVRLIPAHAGKTYPQGRGREPPPAHPRSRGENPPTSTRTSRQLGSSPLTRGKRPPACPGHDLGGLIPAHAGKT